MPAKGRFTCMARLIHAPTVIEAAGNKQKLIEEFVGNVNSKSAHVSIARMKSPSGWTEPGQTPLFSEYSIVLSGALRATTRTQVFNVTAGQGIVVERGEWVRYSTPDDEGAEYISVCIPAF